MTFVDPTAKETKLAKADLKDKVICSASLMPPTFAETLKPEELASLMAYLLGNQK